MTSGPSVQNLGEFGLIDRLIHILGDGDLEVGIGDDTAVIDRPGAEQLLATVDMLVEGVHFTLDGLHPFALGRRALAVNLSDIAAMGGNPLFALVSLALPPDRPARLIVDLYRGLRHEAAAFHTSIVGGNLAGTAGPLVIDLALVGEVARGRAVLRSGAREGDILAVTGVLGAAAAERLSGRQASWVPQPRLRAGKALADAGLAHAMIDLSDGLGGDVHHLAQASGVGAVIEEDALPIAIGARRLAEDNNLDPYELALYGGEDYELLIAMSEDAVERARSLLGPVPLTIVGTVLAAGQGITVEHVGGTRDPLEARGWAHF
jgi:thiamine-monophosphate kinase